MIFVRDVGAMEAFYRDVVGLVPVETTRQPDWVEFETGEGRFSLHQIPPHILPELPPLSVEPREASPTKLSFVAADLNGKVARLRALGVRVIERPWGGFDFVDPEGNIAGLSGPPGAVEPVPLQTPESDAVVDPLAELAPEPASMRTSFLENRIPPLLVTALFAYIMAAIAGMLPQVTFILPERGKIAGGIVLLGLLVMLVAAMQFRRAKTTVDPLHPQAASSLVSGGIFRLSRNPMYLGMAIVLLGWAAFLGNAPALVLGLWGFVAFIGRFQIAPEERVLQGHFGAAFDAYAARTRRWI